MEVGKRGNKKSKKKNSTEGGKQDDKKNLGERGRQDNKKFLWERGRQDDKKRAILASRAAPPLCGLQPKTQSLS